MKQHVTKRFSQQRTTSNKTAFDRLFLRRIINHTLTFTSRPQMQHSSANGGPESGLLQRETALRERGQVFVVGRSPDAGAGWRHHLGEATEKGVGPRNLISAYLKFRLNSIIHPIPPFLLRRSTNLNNIKWKESAELSTRKKSCSHIRSCGGVSLRRITGACSTSSSFFRTLGHLHNRSTLCLVNCRVRAGLFCPANLLFGVRDRRWRRI